MSLTSSLRNDGRSAMMRIVGEAETDCHAGGMTPRAKQETVAAEPKSFTGQYLKPLLERSSPAQAGAQPIKKPRRKASSPEDQPDLIPAK